MKTDTSKRRRAATVAIAAFGLASTVGVAGTGDASALKATEERPDDTPVTSYESGALAGTSETYVNMQDDGSYYDPSLGRRVSPKPSWPYETGAVAGTSETYVNMQDDGSYYDPSLGEPAFPAG